MTSRTYQGSGFRLEFTHEPWHLTARIIGGEDTGVDASMECWREIVGELRSSGATALLVVEMMTGEVMSEEELERFFGLIEGWGLERIHIAYIKGRVDQVARIEVAELLARERGYRVRMFAHEADARVWLRFGKDDAGSRPEA